MSDNFTAVSRANILKLIPHTKTNIFNYLNGHPAQTIDAAMIVQTLLPESMSSLSQPVLGLLLEVPMLP